MNIDNSNAYCRCVPIAHLPLCQGRSILDPFSLLSGLLYTLYNSQIKMPAQCSAVAQHNNSWILMMGWLQLRLHRVRRVGTCLSYIPYLRPNIIRYSIFRPDIKGDYPPNLSILISGGKENNCDSLSNGE